MEKLYSAIDEIVLSIKESKEYKMCLSLKEKMDNNIDLKNKINKIKTLQKKYIRSGYDSSIKSELDKLNEELFNIPIYKIYLDNLEVVNHKIDYVKDSLNDYFYKLFNE